MRLVKDEGFGNYGDPWYDFKAFGENKTHIFQPSLCAAIFSGEPSQMFWDVLTYYIVTAALWKSNNGTRDSGMITMSKIDLNIKMIVTDLDGSLLRTDLSVSERTRSTLSIYRTK